MDERSRVVHICVLAFVLSALVAACGNDPAPGSDPAVGAAFRSRAVAVCGDALAQKKAQGPFLYPGARGWRPPERGVVPPSPVSAVRRFHRAMGLPVRDVPTGDIPTSERELRVSLVDEEAREFAEAASCGDLVEIADALADLVYVTYGAALHYGIDLDAAIAEVHRANMSKVGRRGGAMMRADGKVLKGPTYRAPGLAEVLNLETPNAQDV